MGNEAGNYFPLRDAAPNRFPWAWRRWGVAGRMKLQRCGFALRTRLWQSMADKIGAGWGAAAEDESKAGEFPRRGPSARRFARFVHGQGADMPSSLGKLRIKAWTVRNAGSCAIKLS